MVNRGLIVEPKTLIDQLNISNKMTIAANGIIISNGINLMLVMRSLLHLTAGKLTLGF